MQDFLFPLFFFLYYTTMSVKFHSKHFLCTIIPIHVCQIRQPKMIVSCYICKYTRNDKNIFVNIANTCLSDQCKCVFFPFVILCQMLLYSILIMQSVILLFNVWNGPFFFLLTSSMQMCVSQLFLDMKPFSCYCLSARLWNSSLMVNLPWNETT